MSNDSVSNKKIFILIPPAAGHLNPLLCITSQLVKHGIKVIIFGNEKYEAKIVKSGAIYKAYSDFDLDLAVKKAGQPSPINTWSYLIKTGDRLLPELYQACQEEKPDLIIMDTLSVHTRYLIAYIKNQQAVNKLSFPFPKIIGFFPSLGSKPSEPQTEDQKAKPTKYNSELFKILAELHDEVNKKFNLNIEFNFGKWIGPTDYLNICCVFEELQPNAHLLKDYFKFCGCCIEESFRNEEITNEKLKNILDSVTTLNPIDLKTNNPNQVKIIYASLGTLFNKSIETFEKIIESIKTFNQVEDEKIKSKDLRLVLSLGKESYDLFEERIKNQNFIVPENVVLLPSVPQIEVLKRASLFITHCGMNSTSETIHYGVPLIGIPQMADQPMVANRVCDELKLGIRMDSNNFTMEELRDSIKEILSNTTYLENVLEYSKYSRKSNGILNSSKLILDYLNN